MPTGWATMTSTALPVADYTVPVTNGALTATFTYRVRRQPSSTRTMASLSTTFERFTLTFIVEDVTDYRTDTNPMTVFGSAFTTMAISALRKLLVDTNTMIPKPGSLVTYGAVRSSYVDIVDVAQNGEKTTDVFLVTCNIREMPSSSGAVESEESPKLNKSDDIPPWQMPAEARFEEQTTEGRTLGFAFKTEDLDGKLEYDAEALREKGITASTKKVPVENYANDPFASPPALPSVKGTLHVSKAFLRIDIGDASADFSMKPGKVNGEDITVDIGGAVLFFPKGTLSPTGVGQFPKVYKLPVPWFNKTKHPLGKTYGELFYGYSGTTANRVAINKTGQTILVYKAVRYVEISATFAYSPEGFGIWIANRGYTELDPDSPDGRAAITDKKTNSVKESWLTKAGKKTSQERIYRGFTTVSSSSWVGELIAAFFPSDNSFNWATQADNFGKPTT